MKFIGRQAELNKLNAEYTRDGSFGSSTAAAESAKRR